MSKLDSEHEQPCCVNSSPAGQIPQLRLPVSAVYVPAWQRGLSSQPCPRARNTFAVLAPRSVPEAHGVQDVDEFVVLKKPGSHGTHCIGSLAPVTAEAVPVPRCLWSFSASGETITQPGPPCSALQHFCPSLGVHAAGTEFRAGITVMMRSRLS